jgi:hypothetical protein
MHTLTEEFSRVKVGEGRHFQNLTIFPLLAVEEPPAEPEYLLLDEAIACGAARVKEVTAGARVPELQFENRSDRPVLILDGEELLGAKQNRAVNLTILVGARQKVVIPVSCVEAGRWSMRSPEMRPADRIMYLRARAARTSDVSDSMRFSGARRSDQGAVWDDIGAMAQSLQASSPTRAMGDIFEQYAAVLENCVRAFDCAGTQRGVVFAIAGTVRGMDVFDHPVTLRRVFPKLVRSYALDAIDAAPATPAGPPVTEAASAFLALVAAAEFFALPAVGLGKDVRLSGNRTAGAALWAEGRFVHLCAFARSDGGGQMSARMSRPSRRFWGL